MQHEITSTQDDEHACIMNAKRFSGELLVYVTQSFIFVYTSCAGHAVHPKDDTFSVRYC